MEKSIFLAALVVSFISRIANGTAGGDISTISNLSNRDADVIY